MQAYTLHRNPDVFPSPHEFDPGRWLRADADLATMRESFFAWSSGSRACMGTRLATMELKLIISALVWGWEDYVCRGDDGGIDGDKGSFCDSSEGQGLSVGVHAGQGFGWLRG